MTEAEIRMMAEKALDKIERTPKHQVYASIKGVVAATWEVGDHPEIIFRRENGQVTLEIRIKNYMGHTDAGWTEHPLPLDLQMRATRMLNNL